VAKLWAACAAHLGRWSSPVDIGDGPCEFGPPGVGVALSVACCGGRKNVHDSDADDKKGLLRMTKIVRNHRIGFLAAALVTVGVIAAFATVASFADTGGGNSTDPGRALAGAFCTVTGTTNHLCMQITWDGVTYGTNNRSSDLTLRPGTYWITATDTSAFHNFELRSCPGSTSACGTGAGDELPITGDSVADTPGDVAVKVNLDAGTYRLFCDAPGHEAGGMYVDFQVAGVGQLG
jgi:hypothetical protein